MTRSPQVADDLVPVANRIAGVQLSRVPVFAALPLLAAATPGAAVPPLLLGCALWLAVALASWPLSRFGRTAALTTLNVTLIGDGMVLAWAWYRLDGLDGPVSLVIVLHTIAVTLVTAFRTGAKIALWHSLLAVAVLDAVSAGLLGPARPFPVVDTAVYLGGLWAAALGTACLAAVNERELRRRRYDEQVLRDLALRSGAQADAGAVALGLAAFGYAELSARRAAVAVLTHGDVAGRPDFGAVVDEDGTSRTRILTGPPPAELRPDDVRLLGRPDPVRDAWIHQLLPDPVNVVVVPFAVQDAVGFLVLEQPRRRSARASRRVNRRMLATARQAAAQSAAAVGRALVADQLAAAALTDGLTGTANRRRFDALLAAEVRGPVPFALLLLDLDHFKAVNDTHGHQTGDAVLVAAAAALRAAAGAGSLVARYGGEEFAVLTPVPPAELPAFAERLRRAVADADTPVPVTVSIGAACFPHDDVTEQGLIGLADERLYTAKRAGRDRAVTDGASAAVRHPQPAGLNR
ncbi:GGDEF domain-containing protein [Spirilliplanes yamanashiensis]|uniref:GGDEF domain-containing protein n=1 Tax=Spirilliplanes yamanashiensis TaxID=42233 RepID=A0A8J3Y6F9_9ACTN|nr:GGDEF domain-containing protein [Spirilliplanes yamanashiensis]MDP9815003.1 diguanylate cyclase (GGDEF)-like protein [Spirilliplanes yamanashiensis]GIJ02658.1 hypothetical protein Sya03_20100 [Spirilliplanes yamanashiensis]